MEREFWEFLLLRHNEIVGNFFAAWFVIHNLWQLPVHGTCVVEIGWIERLSVKDE